MVSFFISSSTSYPRLVTIISILLLNPSPFIYGKPTEKIDKHFKLPRQNRHINFNSDDILINKNPAVSEQEIIFEGLLGCKYDSNICNRNEVCFDDALFGHCWNGAGSPGKVFALENGIHRLSNDKLTALEHTIYFLNRYHLDWKDYMTQCILSHILTNHHHKLNRHRLELFYNDCLNKDKLLDNIAAIQEQTNIDRRQINGNNKYYVPSIESENLFEDLHRPFDAPWFIRLSSPVRAIPEKPRKIIAEESIMNKPTKISMNMNEGHPTLVETLQINTNKQVLPPLSSQEAMSINILLFDRIFQFLTFAASKIRTSNSTDAQRYFTVETARGYIIINRNFNDQIEGARLLALIAQLNSWPFSIFTELNADQRTLTFHILDNAYRINARNVASSVLHNQKILENQLGIHIIDSGIGNPNRGAQLSVEQQNGSHFAVITLITCTLVLFIFGSFALLYFIKRNDRIQNKFSDITQVKGLSTDDYQDLCRQRMQTQPTDRKSPEIHQVAPNGSRVKHSSESSSSRSSTSSWIEEPVTSVNMDIMTGHLILSYMEDHLRDRYRLEAEWQSLCTDEANEERPSCSIALSETNTRKNRYIDCIPYNHTRVRLENSDDGDYINASTIFDSNPKCKYIATQAPMPNTTNAFWRMVWEQGSCVIVALARPIENGITMCHHYWPVEGSARFDDFEVNLVSEHSLSEDYVVRSFYLRNLQTTETRTVTQFHFLTWDELCNPPSTKGVLDFRRKVNKCFRGRSSPIIIHCNDGVGRTGTYILLDIVLNRICKGAREINIAATLEHIRDQRAKMVKTKGQFQFVFVAIAEEVTCLLQALPQ